jgi:hypothetical protein
MPKATKSNVSNTQSVDTIKQEWLKVVKEITDATEKLEQLTKRRDELVSQLWTHLNKDPSSTVVDGDDAQANAPAAAPVKKAPAKKGKAVAAPAEEEDDAPAPPATPAKKAPAKKGKAAAAAAPAEEEEEVAAPAPTKKAPAKKGAKAADADSAPATPAPTKKAATKAPAKKVAAPSKGTPKPKLDVDSEDVNQNEDPSSEETDLDSLSSVSSESDVSGGEDN